VAEITFNLTSEKWGLLHSCNYGTGRAAVLGYGTTVQYMCFTEWYVRLEDTARNSDKSRQSKCLLCETQTSQKQIISNFRYTVPYNK